MSLHRFFQLKFPLKTNETVTKLKMFILGLVWFLILTFWVITVNVKYDGACEVTYNFAFVFVIDFLFYILPLGLVIFLNALTLNELKKRNKTNESKGITHNNLRKINVLPPERTAEKSTATTSKNDNKTQNTKSKGMDKHNKPFICLFCVSLTMIVCFTPYIIAFPLNYSCDSDFCIDEILFKFISAMTYLIGVINPVIIIIFQDNYKNEILKFYNKIKTFIFK